MVDHLTAQDLDGLADAVRGAAGADQGVQAASTASWLRNRLRMGTSAASSAVRTARTLFRGPPFRRLDAGIWVNWDIGAADKRFLVAY